MRSFFIISKNILFPFVLTFAVSSPFAFGWGSRGHHTICETAVYLLKNDGLKDYLKTKPQVMGHLCNVPDIYWRNLGAEVSTLGNATHYLDTELLGFKVSTVPLDYQKIVDDFTGLKSVDTGMNVISVPQEFGSLWWRADQFFRLAVGLKDDFKNNPLPQNRIDESSDQFAFNQTVFKFITYLGLMGHFVGDNSQPFHLTTNHDGYDTGNGGIHSYFEDFLVGQFDGDLNASVLKKARGLQEAAKRKSKSAQFLNEDSVLQKMKSMATLSYLEIKTVLALDPVTKKSELKNEKGMKIKTAAERKLSPAQWIKFSPLIIEQMARSSALLAQIWDNAYESVGKPQITKYRGYKYPFTPDFVPPDYYQFAKPPAASK